MQHSSPAEWHKLQTSEKEHRPKKTELPHATEKLLQKVLCSCGSSNKLIEKMSLLAVTIRILLYNKAQTKVLSCYVQLVRDKEPPKWLRIHLHNAISLNRKVQLHCSYHHALGNDSPNYSVRMHHGTYQSRIWIRQRLQHSINQVTDTSHCTITLSEWLIFHFLWSPPSLFEVYFQGISSAVLAPVKAVR